MTYWFRRAQAAEHPDAPVVAMHRIVRLDAVRQSGHSLSVPNRRPRELTSLSWPVSIRTLHPDRRPRPSVGWVVSELSATAVLARAAESFGGVLERRPGVPTERARDCLKETHPGIVCLFACGPQGTFLPNILISAFGWGHRPLIGPHALT